MQNETPASLDPKRKRILLIEDEPIARLQLLQKLRESGFDVDVASNGQVALDRIRAVSPDAIFMDLLLPDVKGVDVIKAARQEPKFRDRPIYVCTSAALIDAWTKRATKAGATKVFNRAVTPMDAIAAVVKADLIGPDSGQSAPASASGEAAHKPNLNPSGDTTKYIPAPPAQKEQPQAKAPAAEPATPLLKRMFSSFKLTKSAPPVRPNAPQAPPSGAPLTTVPPVSVSPPPLSVPPPVPLEEATPTLAPSFPTEPYALTPDININYGEPPVSNLSDQAAVVSFNETGTIVSANEACAVMFGWEGATLVGEGLAALLRPGYRSGC
jgi:CheY-like chemotaxis protein